MNILRLATVFPMRAAIREENRYRTKVAGVANSTLVGADMAREMYLLNAQFNVNMRHGYNIRTGLVLNTQGANQHVQTMITLNNDVTGSATQGSASNQPRYMSDADVGFNVCTFDGVDDFLRSFDTAMLQNVNEGSIIAIAKDTNRAAGDASHNVAYVQNNNFSHRLAVQTRGASAENFRAIGRRLDNDQATTFATTPSAAGWHFLAGIADYQNGVLRGNFDGVMTSDANFLLAAGGTSSGSTSNTPSTEIVLGAQTTAPVSRLPGSLSAVYIFQSVLTQEYINACIDIHKRYGFGIP